jgi:hypothetical protein
MATSEAIKRRVDRAKAAFEEHSAALFKQHLEWKDQQKRGSLGRCFRLRRPGVAEPQVRLGVSRLMRHGAERRR